MFHKIISNEPVTQEEQELSSHSSVTYHLDHRMIPEAASKLMLKITDLRKCLNNVLTYMIIRHQNSGKLKWKTFSCSTISLLYSWLHYPKLIIPHFIQTSCFSVVRNHDSDASPQPVGHQQKEGRIQVGSKWSPYCRLYQEDAVPSRQRQKIKRWTSAISLVLPLALHSIWMRMVMHVTHDEVMRQWKETISKRSKKGRKVDWYSTFFFH